MMDEVAQKIAEAFAPVFAVVPELDHEKVEEAFGLLLKAVALLRTEVDALKTPAAPAA